MLFFSKDH